MGDQLSWVLMVLAAEGCMWGARRIKPIRNFDATPYLVRLGGACYVGGGLMGVQGWLGDTLTTILGWVMSMADSIGQDVVGVGLAAILAIAVGVMWIGAMLPDDVFENDLPDWMVRFGLLLPSVLASAPGPVGEGLRTVVFWAGDLATSLISGGF